MMGHRVTVIEVDYKSSRKKQRESIRRQVPRDTDIIVGHSMGGIRASNMYSGTNIKVISINSPGDIGADFVVKSQGDPLTLFDPNADAWNRGGHFDKQDDLVFGKISQWSSEVRSPELYRGFY